MRPPSQLQGFKFVKVLAGKKEAFEKDTPRYGLTDPSFVEHLNRGGNYGVVGDAEHLIIDCDSDELAMIVRSRLPPTFTCTSATKQKPHFYYRCKWTPRDIPLSDWTMDDAKIGNIGTVRGKGYVVGPFSQVAGRQYLIDNPGPVAEVTEAEVLDVLLPWMAEKTQTIDRELWKGEKNGLEFPILSIPGIRDGLQVHPIHGSSSGSKNLHVDSRKNLWYCFACGAGGDSLQLSAVMNRTIGCWEAGPGALRGDKFKQAKQLAVRDKLITVAQVKEAEEDAEPKPSDTARELMANHRFLTFNDTDEIVVYSENPGVYRNGGESLIARIVENDFEQREMARHVTIHFVREVQGHIRRKTYSERDVFDAELHVLNLKNGLFNLDNGELKPHSPDYPSLIQLPVAYDKNAKCPQILKFLSEVTFPEDRALLQEKVGAVLWKESLQSATLLHGTGANGKSLFLRIVQALVGTKNIAARSLQELEIHKFAKADLFGKMMNVYADLPETAMRSTGTFKILTGGDPIEAEHKFQQPFMFTPYAKHWYSCNRIPKAPDDMDAFFRRWDIITFPNTFLGAKDNRKLYAELTTEEELSGFLNWALEGLKRLRDNSFQFSQSRSVEEIRTEWVRGSDPVKAFVLDWCNIGPDLTIPKAELFQSFVAYCKKHSLPASTNPVFFRNLPSAAPVTTTRLGPEGARVWSIKGLALKADTDRTEDATGGEQGTL